MQPSHGRGWIWLLVVPFVATLVPPLYSREYPAVFGFPFFYWYLLVWVILVGILSAIVLRLVERK